MKIIKNNLNKNVSTDRLTNKFTNKLNSLKWFNLNYRDDLIVLKNPFKSNQLICKRVYQCSNDASEEKDPDIHVNKILFDTIKKENTRAIRSFLLLGSIRICLYNRWQWRSLQGFKDLWSCTIRSHSEPRIPSSTLNRLFNYKHLALIS